jgi:hypothetical protein
MSNKAIAIILFVTGLVGGFFALVSFVAPIAAADAIVQEVRETEGNEIYMKVTERLYAGKKFLFYTDIALWTVVVISAFVLVVRRTSPR